MSSSLDERYTKKTPKEESDGGGSWCVQGQLSSEDRERVPKRKVFLHEFKVRLYLAFFSSRNWFFFSVPIDKGLF